MLSFIVRSAWLLWCWLELTVFTLVLYSLAWLPRPLTQSYYHPLFLIWCRFFVRALGVNLKLHQKNISPLPDQYILIANHPSAFEDVAVPALFDVYPLAKMGVKDWFLVGRINIAADTLFVKRDNPDSRNEAGNNLRRYLKEGKNIALFPEGGCKGRRIYERFQYGAFDISLETGIPILPVFLHYEAQDTFEWRNPQTPIEKMWHFMTSQNNRANYYVFDAIYPTGFKDKAEFSKHVHNLYLQWQARYLE